MTNSKDNDSCGACRARAAQDMDKQNPFPRFFRDVVAPLWAVFFLLAFAWFTITSAVRSLAPFPLTVPSLQDAMRIQVRTITDNVTDLYAGVSEITEGDITEIAIMAGAFYPLTPRTPSDLRDDTVRDREKAMAQLKIDYVRRRVFNVFGGDVRVFGGDNAVRVVYRNVPENICRDTGAECE